jgi:hypothetical protein
VTARDPDRVSFASAPSVKNTFGEPGAIASSRSASSDSPGTLRSAPQAAVGLALDGGDDAPLTVPALTW